MKRLGKIICLSAIIALMAVNVSFGSGLTLEQSFPEEGKSNLNPQNIAVKLVFSEKISDPVSMAANANSFLIADAEGEPVEFEPLYNEEKYPNEVWLQITSTLIQNSAYKVTVLEGMQSSGGNVLDKPIELNFSTRNTEADSKGYMVLMMIMIVGMMAFSVLDARRKVKKEEAGSEESWKVNPYKEAKRTGKSVEEVIAKMEKEKAQAERRRARAARKEGQDGEEERPSRPGVVRVKEAKPISKKGYKTPEDFINRRIAREEAIAKEKARKTQQTRSKGSKQQQRKKK